MESETDWRDIGDGVSTIAEINTSSVGLLPLALYYAFHAIRDGAHCVAEATQSL